MKTLSLLVAVITVLSGCSKKSNESSGSCPLFFEAYFEFLGTENKPYTDSVESAVMIRTDANELKPYRGTLTWIKLPQQLMNNRTVYGPETLGGNMEPGEDKYKGGPLTFRNIRLVRFGGADVDTLEWESTLKVVDNDKIRSDKYEFYYNGKKVNTLHTKDYSGPWIITIQKER